MHLDSKWCLFRGRDACDLPGGSLESFFVSASFFFDRCHSVSRVSPYGSAGGWRLASAIVEVDVRCWLMRWSWASSFDGRLLVNTYILLSTMNTTAPGGLLVAI